MQVQVNLGCFPSISIISETNFLHRKLSAKYLIPHYIAFRSAWVIVLCFFNTSCNSEKKSINNSNNNNNNNNNNYKKKTTINIEVNDPILGRISSMHLIKTIFERSGK